MKSFHDIQNHLSYLRLPLTVREVLRIAFTDSDHDILKALRDVSPRAARATLDIQLDTVKKILSLPDVHILTVLFTFGLDLYTLRGAPDSPVDVEVI
jgi:hypothetical protein